MGVVTLEDSVRLWQYLLRTCARKLQLCVYVEESERGEEPAPLRHCFSLEEDRPRHLGL